MQKLKITELSLCFKQDYNESVPKRDERRDGKAAEPEPNTV